MGGFWYIAVFFFGTCPGGICVCPFCMASCLCGVGHEMAAIAFICSCADWPMILSISLAWPSSLASYGRLSFLQSWSAKVMCQDFQRAAKLGAHQSVLVHAQVQ
uniref:Uncharacterized protein n=1 Tax=Eutreptiella gymnastica TaxID=73025 RepID=A0A7S4FQW0_9EUGL